MGRTIAAVVAGVVGGGILITLVQIGGNTLFPPPEGMDTSNMESIREHMDQIPLASLLWVLLSYAVGCFAGGFLATRIARTGTLTPALSVGIVFFLFGIMNLIMLPHPVWFMIASQATYIAAAWAGGRMVPAKAMPE